MTDILITAIKRTDIDDQDEIIVQLSNISRIIKSRATKIQIIDTLKVTDALFNSLQGINPEDFNPDVVISRMSAQLFTQSQLRFLIHVSKVASIPLLLRFSLKDAMDAPTLMTLVRTLIERVSKRVHSANLAAVCPVYKGWSKPPLITPKPLDKDQFSPPQELISNWCLSSQKPQFRPVNCENWKSSPIIIQTTNKATSIAFTTDCRFMVSAGNSVELYRLESIKNHGIDFGRLPVKLDLPEPATSVATVPNYIFIGTSKGVYKTQIFEKIEKPKIQKILDLETSVTCIERISDSLFIIICYKNGDVYGCMEEECKFMFSIPNNFGVPISVCSVNQKNEYIIGTDAGYLISRSITLSCPIRIVRISNMPARVAKHNTDSIVVTAGPYAAIVDRKLSKIIISFTQPPSHVRNVCVVDRTLVTSHSDGGMRSWLDGKIYSLVDGTMQRAKNEYVWLAQPSFAEPIHKSDVVALINIPALTAAASLDSDGVIIIWSVI